MDNNNSRCLVAFDFDQTIIDGDTTSELISLVKDQSALERKELTGTSWLDFTDLLCERLRHEGADVNYIRERIEKIKFTLSFKELLDYLLEKKEMYEVIILSGTLNILIEWILTYNGYSELAKNIISHQAVVDEDNFLRFIRREAHSCNLCDYSLCKSVLLSNHIRSKQFDKVVFIGDGIIDYCVAPILRENDYLFPRINYGLYKRLYEENLISFVKCNVVSWSDGKKILEHIQKVHMRYE